MINLATLSSGRLRPGVFRLAEVYTVESLSSVASTLRAHLFALNLSNVHARQDFFDELMRAIHYTIHRINNWDAMIDITSDLSWVRPVAAKTPIIVSLTGGAAFLDGNSNDYAKALDCFNSVIDRWFLRRVAMYLVVADDGSLPADKSMGIETIA
jgi:hypothetical protein